MSRKRTRFSFAEVEALGAEAERARLALRNLSDHLKAANLAHTRSGFYDAAVIRESDRLYGMLGGLDRLLEAEAERHRCYPAVISSDKQKCEATR